MAIKSYFFDAQVDAAGDFDRVYSAGDFSRYLEGIVGNGVIPTPSTALQVVANGGNEVCVLPGSAWIRGHKLENDGQYTLTITPTSSMQTDYVSIVATCSETDRQCYIKEVHSDRPGWEPSRTEAIYDLVLAEVVIPAGATTITDAMITDMRANSEKCGYVAGLIQQIDTTTLWNDYRAAQEAFVSRANTTITDIQEDGAAAVNAIMAGAQNAFLGLKKYEANDLRVSVGLRYLKVDKFFEDASKEPPRFDGLTDTLEIYRNGLKLVEGYDYVVEYSENDGWYARPAESNRWITDRRTGELISRLVELAVVVYKPEKPAAIILNSTLDELQAKGIYGFDCKVYTRTQTAETDVDFIGFPLVVNAQAYNAETDLLQVSVNGRQLRPEQYTVVTSSMSILPGLRVGTTYGEEPYGALKAGDEVRAIYYKPNEE